MSIQDLGSLGELIASIGVLITLLYLGLQIRQNTKATRATLTWEMMNSYNSSHDVIIQTPELWPVMRKAVEGGELSEDETFAIRSFVYRMFNTLLAIHQAFTDGQISQEVYDHAKEDATFLLSDNLKPHLLEVLRLAPADLVDKMFGDEIANEVKGRT